MHHPAIMDTVTQVDTQKKEPLVSILMLTYNRASYLKQAIESVLQQSYQNFELIIIDDGSTDNTTSVLAGFKDARIRLVLHKENKGLLARRQESLLLAQGTYVAVLDSDDLWESEKLATQITYLESHPDCVLIGTWITRIDETGNPRGTTNYANEDAFIRRKIFWRNQFAHSSVLMRKDALDKTSGYRFPLDEDLDLFLQIGLHGTFANIPEPLTKYRVHAGGKSANRKGMIENVLKIIKTHRTRYPGYVWAYIKYTTASLVAFVRN